MSAPADAFDLQRCEHEPGGGTGRHVRDVADCSFPFFNTSFRLYVLTTNDACNGRSAPIPAIVAAPAPTAAPAAGTPPGVLSAETRDNIIGGVVGGVVALAVLVLAFVFRAKIAAACCKKQSDSQFVNVDMGRKDPL